VMKAEHAERRDRRRAVIVWRLLGTDPRAQRVQTASR
jgi:hypothetical protein